jgi:hypothetical protein
MVREGLVLLLGTLLVLTTAGLCEAQVFPRVDGAADWERRDGVFEGAPSFSVNPGIKKFINSFASYQWPYAPGYVGQSRLEFPIDNWFGGIQFSHAYYNMSFNMEGWCRLNEGIALKTQDSDWTDGVYSPDQKTAFSETNNRMPRGFLLDVNADWQALSISGGGLRPVAGVRYQSLYFIAGDGYQWALRHSSYGTQPLIGDTYDVSFTFLQFYLGAKSFLQLGPVGATFQADYALLQADVVDHHLLYVNEISQKGSGYAWHLAAGASIAVRGFLRLRIEGDFKRLVTPDCSHNWWDGGTTLLQWGGAKIWSDQQSVTGYADLRF